MDKPFINYDFTTKTLLLINSVVAIIYFSWWLVPSHIGQPFLYGLLFIGEIYHVGMALTFWYTIWPKQSRHEYTDLVQQRNYQTAFAPTVDIYIPVAGEPESVVRETILAAQAIIYPHKIIYVLNDGYVAQKDNWKEIENLAKSLNVNCITRKIPGGAKAGNVNHALKKSNGEIIVLFDADMVAMPIFLQTIIPYFMRPDVAFVQSPQYYKNFDDNEITRGSWEQQDFFFGPILIGKNNYNSAFICGTNVAIRRNVLEEVGGLYEKSIAEDFLTSLLIHKNGWRSIYIPQVLATGLAPIDLNSYYKQQLRWARGSLEILFKYNPLSQKGLTRSQKIQYFISALYYLNGVIVLIDMLMPLVFLLFGIQPVAATTTSFALFFIPYIMLSLFTIYLVSRQSMTFRAFSFAQGSFILQIQALLSILLRRQMAFAVTPKQQQQANYLPLILPHIIYILMAIIVCAVGLHREGINPSIVTNIAWVSFNIALFLPFIFSALNLHTHTVLSTATVNPIR